MSAEFPGEAARAAPAARPIDQALQGDLGALYTLAQASTHVFASPLGPLAGGPPQACLHRFVFFGPHASDSSWRLSFLAGFDHRDHRASRAIVSLVARLESNSETGHALNLSFFPVVDAGGAAGRPPAGSLSAAHWGSGSAPELQLLEKDARQRTYHGFVRVESATDGEDTISIRIRGSFSNEQSPDLELITSEETDGFPVRFEADARTGPARDGPLTVAADLPAEPFELTIKIPASWEDEAYRVAAVTLLERFLRRYRAFQAFGQHL